MAYFALDCLYDDICKIVYKCPTTLKYFLQISVYICFYGIAYYLLKISHYEFSLNTYITCMSASAHCILLGLWNLTCMIVWYLFHRTIFMCLELAIWTIWHDFAYNLSYLTVTCTRSPQIHCRNHNSRYIKCIHRVVLWVTLLWSRHGCFCCHYSDVRMGMVASQITSLTIVCLTVYSGEDQRKHESSAPLAFVWGIHRGPVNFQHKWPVTRKMFPFDDVIMPCGILRRILRGCFTDISWIVWLPRCLWRNPYKVILTAGTFSIYTEMDCDLLCCDHVMSHFDHMLYI